ncbi:PD40 domain-containing protein [Metabacillus idriensis]|uniref:PD40 domain-containing protein n=1 Tax=Metabacillus idriensis TaxID=324768 RepID=UPI001747F7FA|nr:PD40 domain-containing protein [Metabacillus idriensis]
MKIKLIMLLACFFSAPQLFHAQQTLKPLNAAFIRDDNLWIKANQSEERLTNIGNISSPQWSFDGRKLLYQKGSYETKHEVWVYDLKTHSHKKIAENGENPKWSPSSHLIAYVDQGSLKVSDLKDFYNVTFGVDDYAWLPDGTGFILSSSASLLPSGWTNPVLYKIKLNISLSSQQSVENADEFFRIPKTLSKNQTSIMAIGASNFAFSPDGKWISFIVSPTASWSMDSNFVCVISIDGAQFEVLDEVISHLTSPGWAPGINSLAYIEGGGRIVFGFKNKHLKIKEIPVSQTLTPKNYAELAFTWISNDKLAVSRVRETEWSNDIMKQPLPQLYLVSTANTVQKRLTASGGNYDPFYIRSAAKLAWYKSISLTGHRDVWISNPDGSEAHLWVKNADSLTVFPK